HSISPDAAYPNRTAAGAVQATCSNEVSLSCPLIDIPAYVSEGGRVRPGDGGVSQGPVTGDVLVGINAVRSTRRVRVVCVCHRGGEIPCSGRSRKSDGQRRVIRCRITYWKRAGRSSRREMQ